MRYSASCTVVGMVGNEWVARVGNDRRDNRTDLRWGKGNLEVQPIRKTLGTQLRWAVLSLCLLRVCSSVLRFLGVWSVLTAHCWLRG
jgi:hypothetical protein